MGTWVSEKNNFYLGVPVQNVHSVSNSQELFLVVCIFFILKANSKNPWFEFSKIGPKEEGKWIWGEGWERQVISIEGVERKNHHTLGQGWSWDHPHLALLVTVNIQRSYKKLAAPQSSRPTANGIPDTSTGWLIGFSDWTRPKPTPGSLTKLIPPLTASSPPQQMALLPRVGQKHKHYPWQSLLAHPSPWLIHEQDLLALSL